MTKRRIVEAGMKTIESGGMAELTIEALCSQVGITKKSFYYHFSSKDELVAASALRLKQVTLDWVRTIVTESKATNLRELFVDLFKSFHAFGTREDWHGCFAQRLVTELSNQAGHPARKVAVEFCDELEAMFKDLLSRSGQSRPSETAHLLMMLFSGLNVSLLAKRDIQVSLDATLDVIRHVIAELPR